MVSMSTDIIKRCPICNEEVKLMFLNCETFEDNVWDESIGNVATWFKCYGCDSEFFHDEPIDTPEKQIEWWNTRKPLERIVERLEERTEYFKDCTKYGNETEEQEERSYSTMMMYEVACLVDDLIEIVKEEGGMNG